MKKDFISITVFITLLVIALIRFFDSSVYTNLSAVDAGIIQEYIKKSLSWGTFFGGSIAALIVLIAKLSRKYK